MIIEFRCRTLLPTRPPSKTGPLASLPCGRASYLEIIDAQIQMYPAEQSAIVYDLGRKVAPVNLYRALGGGWNLNDAQWISTSGTSAPAQSPTP